MVLKQTISILVFLLQLYVCSAQQKRKDLLFGYLDFQQTDSGLVLIKYAQKSCKNYLQESELLMEKKAMPSKTLTISAPYKEKVPFLSVHGNITYDFFYRSRIDTPFNQQDLQQHTEKVWLDILVKGKYPVKVGFTSRQSNSPFFSNYTDANFQWDKESYKRNYKRNLFNKLALNLPEHQLLKGLDSAIERNRNNVNLSDLKLKGPGILQKVIEERERQYHKGNNPDLTDIYDVNSQDSLADSHVNKTALIKKGKKWYQSGETEFPNTEDSMIMRTEEDYQQSEKYRDSLAHLVEKLSRSRDSLKYVMQYKSQRLQQNINDARDWKELDKLVTRNGLENETKGFNKLLASVNTFSVGRSMLDYTELTAQHIMISGINVEVNPSYYAAFAAGKINYRFRDFLTKNNNRGNNQYLLLGRIGIGNKQKQTIIFTLFQGRKSQGEYAISDSITNDVNLLGYSVEAIVRKGPNSFLSAEFAKSTKPVIGRGIGAEKQTDVLWKFSDASNMGINIKGETRLAKTDTRLSAFYRKTGNNFQSFSLFSYNSNQTAWQAKAEQYIFKNRIGLTAMLRQNDFANLFTQRTYKATTVFKTFLLNIRVPKYPNLSFGYYPGTQLYFVDKEKIRENAYYILNGSVIYNYLHKGVSMTSSFVFNRYINQASDSGFILYRGTNYYASQSLFLKKIQLQGGYAFNKQPELQYHSFEASADLNVRKWLKLGAGSKYNSVKSGDGYWGQRLQLSMQFRLIGAIHLQYEKSYLPTISQTLFPIESGRIMWYKNF